MNTKDPTISYSQLGHTMIQLAIENGVSTKGVLPMDIIMSLPKSEGCKAIATRIAGMDRILTTLLKKGLMTAHKPKGTNK